MTANNTHTTETTINNAGVPPAPPEAHQIAGRKGWKSKSADATRRDIYQEITTNMIASLEKGVAPWRCPWDRSGAISMPSNRRTGANYRGINIPILWAAQAEHGFASSEWLTYKQAQELGGQVRKGEKGTVGIFFKTLEKETGETDQDGDPEIARIPMARAFVVFNLDQIDGIERPQQPERAAEVFDPLPHVETVLAASGVSFVAGGTKAAYYPHADFIAMPDRWRFTEARDYYATALHELAHATKHPSRCDRKPYETTVKRGSYAFEELVAELGALFAAASLGLGGDVQGHDSYIAAWLSVLKEDKRAIFRAASLAQKAADWIAALDATETH